MSEGKKRPWRHRLFTGAVIVLGMGTILAGLIDWAPKSLLRTSCFLLVALIASGLRLNLTPIVGTMSVNFVFVLLGILELSLGETLVMACISAAAQALVHRQQSRVPASTLFHVANAAITATIAFRVYHSPAVTGVGAGQAGSVLSLAVAATVLFAMNTFPVAAVYTLAENRNLAWVWRECNFRTFPFYLVGAVAAGVFHFSSQVAGTQSPLLLVPVGFIIYCSYYSYLGRIAQEKVHVEDQAALHLRTIEALAMAIEAKDLTTHNHLRRLQLYCAELGKELKLPPREMEALQAATMLHDIGKLAVPEHILSKPGKLSREEFEKVKIHPIVGAEILERVNFPYPVARVVRCHHEKWNGSGYPHGLKGEEIPVSARILSAVDCFDALISDRTYRRALPLEEAIGRLSAEAGTSFDPQVVEIVLRRHQELESRLVGPGAAVKPSYERDVATEIFYTPRIAPPADGASAAKPGEDQRKPAYLDTIAAARHEAQVLMELTHELGNSLHLDETLSMLSAALGRIVAFDALVIYVRREEYLVPRFASGESTSLFLSRQIQMGEGIAGWVAKHRKPVLNGSPALEMGASSEAMRNVLLDSALAVPLPGTSEVSGVALACRRGRDAFDTDDLRILLAVSAKLGTVIENALKYEQAAASASTDFLTELPNARALQQQLESELSRCRRAGGTLTVLVTDLDGFKEVNDRYGHPVGNSVLRAVALALRENCREYDYVARLGGDEFVILLPGLEEEDTVLKIAQFNRAAAEAARGVIPLPQLSLSVGQARYPQDGGEPERLLAEADRRMYQTKASRKPKSRRGLPREYEFDWLETSSRQ